MRADEVFSPFSLLLMRFFSFFLHQCTKIRCKWGIFRIDFKLFSPFTQICTAVALRLSSCFLQQCESTRTDVKFTPGLHTRFSTQTKYSTTHRKNRFRGTFHDFFFYSISTIVRDDDDNGKFRDTADDTKNSTNTDGGGLQISYQNKWFNFPAF